MKEEKALEKTTTKQVNTRAIHQYQFIVIHQLSNKSNALIETNHGSQIKIEDAII